MFSEFVEGTTALSGVTAHEVLPGWGTVTLLLAQKNGQLGAQLSMSRVLYIPQSPANLISLAKLNDVGLYWDNRTWTLYNAEGYIPKWHQSWIFRLWTMDIEDIAIGITRIDKDTYQWPQDQLLEVFAIRKGSVENLSTWHSRLGHLNFATLRTYLKQLQINFLDDTSEQFV